MPLHHGTLGLTMRDDTLVAVKPGPGHTLYERIGVGGRTLGAFGDGGYVGSSCTQCSMFDYDPGR